MTDSVEQRVKSWFGGEVLRVNLSEFVSKMARLVSYLHHTGLSSRNARHSVNSASREWWPRGTGFWKCFVWVNTCHWLRDHRAELAKDNLSKSGFGEKEEIGLFRCLLSSLVLVYRNDIEKDFVRTPSLETDVHHRVPAPDPVSYQS